MVFQHQAASRIAVIETAVASSSWPCSNEMDQCSGELAMKWEGHC